MLYYSKEEQRYGRNKDTVINHAYICSGEYRKKFDQISDNKKLNKLLYQLAKTMLEHRSGTLYEDMYWIDAETLQVVCKVIDIMVEQKIIYTQNIKKRLHKRKNLITIHSHPNGFPPSLDDFNSACLNGYSVGVVCGHNGDIFLYQSQEFMPEESYYYLINDFIKEGYSTYVSQVKALEELSRHYNIFFRKVEA